MDKAINVAVSSDKDNGNEFTGDDLNMLPEMNCYSGKIGDRPRLSWMQNYYQRRWRGDR